MSESSPVTFQTTLHVRDHCLCLHVQRAARAVARRYDEALRPFGLSNGQFSLLMSLNRPEPPTIGSVSALLAMDRTTLTAKLKPLERRGLLDVRADAQDKRSRRLALTEAGLALLAAAMPTWHQAQAQNEGLIVGSTPDALRASLRSLSEAC
jgi:DNA-binding MarR family transcriptional regulator